jgi:hypothetical protein
MTGDSTGIGQRPEGCRLLGPRDKLIDAVRLGITKPEEAELVAEKLGLKPLEWKPDPAKFDPHQLAYWTLPMALAWIAYQTDDAVRGVWDDYRAECRVWEACDLRAADGTRYLYSLNSLPPVKLWDYVNVGIEEDTGRRASAKRQLWHALQERELVAIGVDLSSHKRIEIPGYLWSSLDCPALSRSPYLYRSSNSSDSFEHVLVLSSDVKKLWPERQSTSADEQRCARWLAEKMRQTERPIPKNRLRLQWEAEFGRIGQHAFRRAWENATGAPGVSPAWRKAGRRKT